MLTILLNPSNPEPLYQQICTAIREDIAQGVLHPDEKLPSRRALSAHLQTSIVTVQTAYEQLAAEGYLYSRPRAGYFVDPDAPLLAHMPKETAFPSSQPAKTDPDDRIVFSTSGVDLEQFPFATWAKLSRKSCCNRRRQWACTNCGRQLRLICGHFGIFMRHRSKFWWVPVRNICWGFWCSCWVRPAAMPWKNPAIPKANAFYAATVPR